uniref:Uncharacterized protein n=1 Tax=uncultured marine bacterium 159 TaxID=257384 RepID=Q6SHV9_9BACT|nr:hypothetical protein MBMO_EBAC750-03B02.15 [uncultured marine bacterium 159]
MEKCGFGLNIFAVIVIVSLLYFIIMPIFGVSGVSPIWM